MLSALLDNLPGMAYRCHANTTRTMLYVSSGCFDLTGFGADELIEDRVIAYHDLIYSEDKAAVLQVIESAIVEKKPYQCTYRLISADGQEHWVQDKGEAVTSPDGQIVGLEGFVADQTERKTNLDSLEQRVADRTRKLTALYDILEAASDSGDLQTTISRSLQRVLKAVKGNVGAIHLLDKTGEFLILTAQQELPEAAAALFARMPVQDSQLAGWVLRNNKPLLIPKLSQDARAAGLAGSSELDVYIGVPIVANERVRGVLSVMSNEFSTYAAVEEMELLSSVGEQLGVVVENARLRQQAGQLLVLEERNRLARELHDSVTQSIYSVTLFAEAGINLTGAGEHEKAGPLFSDILETGQQALKEMRLLVHKLRPSVLEKEGLVQALRHRLSAVEGRAGVKNQLIVKGTPELSAEIEEVLYHVAQEALNNAVKHANAGEVKLYLQQDALVGVTLIVKDNGQGFDTSEAALGSGLGLISMRERVEKLGGSIAYQSAFGEGTEVKVCLPTERPG